MEHLRSVLPVYCNLGLKSGQKSWFLSVFDLVYGLEQTLVWSGVRTWSGAVAGRRWATFPGCLGSEDASEAQWAERRAWSPGSGSMNKRCEI